MPSSDLCSDCLPSVVVFIEPAPGEALASTSAYWSWSSPHGGAWGQRAIEKRACVRAVRACGACGGSACGACSQSFDLLARWCCSQRKLTLASPHHASPCARAARARACVPARVKAGRACPPSKLRHVPRGRARRTCTVVAIIYASSLPIPCPATPWAQLTILAASWRPPRAARRRRRRGPPRAPLTCSSCPAPPRRSQRGQPPRG